jgi:hypothetical protein
MRPLPTLLALSLAAAVGGFAATAIHASLDKPAQALPATAATVPAIAALPAAVGGQALPRSMPRDAKARVRGRAGSA